MLLRAKRLLVILATAVLNNQSNANDTKPLDQMSALRLITRSPWAIQTKLKSSNPLVHESTPIAPIVSPPDIGSFEAIRKKQDAQADALEHPAEMTTVPFLSLGAGYEIGEVPNALGSIKPKPILNPAEAPPEKHDSLALPQGTVLVLWDSARPVIQAKKSLGISDTSNVRASESYVVSVVGYSLATDLPLNALKNTILESAVLIPHGREAITATDVELTGSSVALTLRYFFPKRSIELSDKDVQFQMQVGLAGLVETTFVLKNMFYEGKLAIADYSPRAPSVTSTSLPAQATAAAANNGVIGAGVSQLYRHALVMVQSGDLDTGIRELQEVVKLNPDQAESHYDLASALERKHKRDDAMTEYRQVIRLNPADVRAHENLANILDDKGESDAAVAEYRLALKYAPEKASLHQNLGLALLRQEHLDEAISESRESLRLNPEQQVAHYQIARALEKKGDLNGAISEYRLEKKPAAESHYYLGRLLRDTGDVSGALAEFRTALAMDPGNKLYQDKLQELSQRIQKH